MTAINRPWVELLGGYILCKPHYGKDWLEVVMTLGWGFKKHDYAIIEQSNNMVDINHPVLQSYRVVWCVWYPWPCWLSLWWWYMLSIAGWYRTTISRTWNNIFITILIEFQGFLCSGPPINSITKKSQNTSINFFSLASSCNLILADWF